MTPDNLLYECDRCGGAFPVDDLEGFPCCNGVFCSECSLVHDSERIVVN